MSSPNRSPEPKIISIGSSSSEDEDVLSNVQPNRRRTRRETAARLNNQLRPQKRRILDVNVEEKIEDDSDVMIAPFCVDEVMSNKKINTENIVKLAKIVATTFPSVLNPLDFKPLLM